MSNSHQPEHGQPEQWANPSYDQPTQYDQYGQPWGQASASQPSANPTWEQPAQPGAGYAPSPMGQQPVAGGSSPYAMNPTTDNRGKRPEGGLGALFDFSFRKYVTPTIAKIVYILTMAMAVLQWFGPVVVMFMMAGAVGDGDGAAGFSVMAFAFLFVGWIPALFQIVITRIILELTLANIRTAEDADAIRTRLG